MHERFDRCRRNEAFARKFRARFFARVIADYLVAASGKALRHIAAHAAETQHANLHRCPSRKKTFIASARPCRQPRRQALSMQIPARGRPQRRVQMDDAAAAMDTL
jgi:hypothetical protein